MRYATWSVYFPEPDSLEGFTPEAIIRQRGGEANGAFIVTNSTFLGYVSDNADLTGLENFNVVEITQAEALTLAQEQNPGAGFAEDGSFTIPSVPPIGS
jgi:hypothetical protein